MQRDLLKNISNSVVLVLALYGFQAYADVSVLDDGFSFSPDPVNIVTGEAVFWSDDGTGPYEIISDSSAWTPFYTPGGVLFLTPGTYTYHDDFGDFGTIYVTANLPPSVTITNPAANAVLTAPATFEFSVDASDPDDGLSDVEFYVGANLVDDVFSAPFATGITNLAAGTYVLTAIAYDNVGATATNSITIYVQNPAPVSLSSPRVVAGQFLFQASGLVPGKTNVLQTSTNLLSPANWVSVSTNVAATNTVSFTNSAQTKRSFFRLIELP